LSVIKNMNQKGFLLVMLIIVIAIIAFLVVGGMYVSGVGKHQRSLIETKVDASKQIEDIQNLLNIHGERIQGESQE